MTFTVQQPDPWKRFPVRITYGPITIEVLEELGHLRSFWNELGKRLDESENTQGGLD